MKKKTFLITGASKGIGLSAAKILVKQGHSIIGLARSQPSLDLKGEFIAIDLLNHHKLKDVLKDVTSRHHLDGVFNNVGLVHPAPLEEITEQQLNSCYHMNVNVAVQCVQAALPHMKGQHFGRVVNTASLTVAGAPYRSSYAAAKSALVSMTRTWALELASHQITVNAISPGPIETELFNTNNPPGSESRERYIKNIPIGRTGKAEEVGELVAFLMSDQASFITGQNIFIDGGSSVGKSLN
ncbi:MAG: SDR family oxidoreductase [Verrucomicrobiota bacterium]